MKKICLLLFFAITFQIVNTIAQPNWAVVTSQNFNTANTSLNTVPNLSYFGFSVGKYGTTGTPFDKCAKSKTFTTGAFLAFEVTLSIDKEYRFSYTAKSDTDDRKLQFKYNTIPGSSGTAIGSAINIPQIPTNGNSLLVSGDAFSGLEGTYYLIITVADGSGNAPLPNVRFDDFVLESKSLPVATYDFTTSSTTIEEGGSIEVCVDVAPAAEQNTIAIEVNLTATTFPHFDGYTTQILTFAPNETQQCFTLTTDEDNGIEDENDTYTFELTSTSQGTTAGTATTLTVTVMEGDGCPYAGLDQTICEGQCVTIGCPEETETNYCYKWIPATGITEGQEFSSQPVACPTETTTYTVYVTDHQGNLVGEDEVVITVTHFDIAITPNPAVICSLEDPLMLDGGEDFIDYIWRDAQGEEIGYGRFLPVTQAGDYSVSIADTEGCESSASINVTATIPTVTITPSAPVLCSATSIITLQADGGFTDYLWTNVADETIGTTANLQIGNSALYAVLVTDANGCQATTMIDIEESTIVDLEVTPPNPGICVSDPAFSGIDNGLRNNVCSNDLTLETIISYTSYEWADESGTFLTDNPSLGVAEAGIYNLMITDEYGCIGETVIEVNPCTATELAIIPELPKLCASGNPLILDAGEGFSSYQWSDGTAAQTLTVITSGEYGLTVTDENGCSQSKTIEVGALEGGEMVDIEMFKPAVIAGNTTTLVDDEDGMTFVNLDNDDKDKWFDNHKKEKEVISDDGSITADDELIRLKLKLKTSTGNHKVKLSLATSTPSGGNFIKIWYTADKTGGEYTLGDEIELTTTEGEFMTGELWVEGIEAHTMQRETRLKLLYSDKPECTVDSEVALTIVGVKELTWEAINNGFTVSGLLHDNPSTLDNDSNFPTGVSNGSGSIDLSSKRVFPGGRYDSSSMSVGMQRDKVKLKIELSVEPIESISLFIKSFDVDDPSSDKKFIDPNDAAPCGSGIPCIYAGTSIVYTNEEDNRGEVNGNKAGELSGQDASGIVNLLFPAGVAIAEIGFQTSLHPGDNYRVVSTFDRDFILDLRNFDKKDKFKVVSLNAGKNKEIQFPELYASAVLTVWRILHVEYDSMDSFNWSDNQKNTNLTGFSGSKATKANSITISGTFQTISLGLNDISLDLTSPSFKGRFEMGTLLLPNSTTIGPMTSGMPWTSPLEGNDNAMKELKFTSKQDVISNTNCILTSSDGIVTATGIVVEIKKLSGLGSAFEYEISGIPNLMPFVGGTIAVGGSTVAIPIISVVSVTLGNSKLETDWLRIPIILRDDDSAPSNLPYINSLMGLNNTYSSAYLLCQNDGGGKLSNNTLNIGFEPNIYVDQYAIDGVLARNQIPDNQIENFNNNRESKVYEGSNYWVVYIVNCWQGGTLSDGDSNSESISLGINNPYQLGVGYNFDFQLSDKNLARGQEIVMLFQEGMLDFYKIRSYLGILPSIFSTFADVENWYTAHEVGHSFGLTHGDTTAPYISEFISSNMGIMTSNSLLAGSTIDLIPRHINLVRSRLRSPGQN